MFGEPLTAKTAIGGSHDQIRGHFLGTILCVNQSVDTTDASILELIDGQQRMTTLSLLLAALLKTLEAHTSDLDEEGRADVVHLRRHLAYSKKPAKPLRGARP